MGSCRWCAAFFVAFSLASKHQSFSHVVVQAGSIKSDLFGKDEAEDPEAGRKAKEDVARERERRVRGTRRCRAHVVGW